MQIIGTIIVMILNIHEKITYEYKTQTIEQSVMVIGIGSRSHTVNLQFFKKKAYYRMCNHIYF